MQNRLKVLTIALAMTVSIGGGSVAFGSSNHVREASTIASQSNHRINLKGTGFAGSWAGELDGFIGFQAKIKNNGTGTVTLTQVQCVATLSYIGLVDHALSLRYVVTVDPLGVCTKAGVITARMTGKNSSTWNFVGDDGVILTGLATRTLTHRANLK